MTHSFGEKIMCGVALAAAVFAAGVGLRSCGGNMGEGTAKVGPKLKERPERGPVVPSAPGKKPRAQPPNIKDRLQSNTEVKK